MNERGPHKLIYPMSSPESVHSVLSWESLEEVCHQAVFLSACRLSLPPKPLFHIQSLALFFRKRCSPLPQFPTEVQPAPCLCSQTYWPPQRNNSSFLDLPSCKALTGSSSRLLHPCTTLVSLHSTHAESLSSQMKTTSKAAIYWLRPFLHN